MWQNSVYFFYFFTFWPLCSGALASRHFFGKAILKHHVAEIFVVKNLFNTNTSQVGNQKSSTLNGTMLFFRGRKIERKQVRGRAEGREGSVKKSVGPGGLWITTRATVHQTEWERCHKGVIHIHTASDLKSSAPDESWRSSVISATVAFCPPPLKTAGNERKSIINSCSFYMQKRQTLNQK